jgi:hypothetical protein
MGDFVSGSAMWLTVSATLEAVSLEPSEQVTSLRMVNVTESGFTSHFSAIPGTGEPSAAVWTRLS